MKIQLNPNIPPNLYENKNILSKLVFLSYHIASYKTISESMGFNSQDISVDEIYDFIQDLKLDITNRVPVSTSHRWHSSWIVSDIHPVSTHERTPTC